MREEKENTSNASVIRVHKNRNYTVISNEVLFDKPPLSLSAKGLLCNMLALPDDWNYSINGLVAMCKEGRHSVKSTLKELKERGYLIIEKIPPNKSETGRFEYIYHIYESKQIPEKQEVENQPLEIQVAEVQTAENQSAEIQELENLQQLNTNELKTKKEKTKKPKEEKQKISFGEFQNIFLTQPEIDKLKVLYINETKFNEGIEILSSYKESSGKKYKSDYAVLNKSNWVYKKVFPKVSQLHFVSNEANGGKYSKCYG